MVVGNRDDEYRARAAADGFDVADIDAATARADVVYVLISDEAIPACSSRSSARRCDLERRCASRPATAWPTAT